MGDYFGVHFYKTTYRAEAMAGISMFMSVVYILVVNPSVLSGCGMNYASVYLATVITSALSTLIMAVYAKIPIVMAPGLSINTMFVTITMNYLDGDYHMTLLATYLSGVMFIVLVVSGVYAKIDRIIPHCVKYGILAGVGLSLVRVGLDFFSFFENPIKLETGIVVFGILLIALFRHLKLKGAMLYGMIVTAFVGYGVIDYLGNDDILDSLNLILGENSLLTLDSEKFFADCFQVPSFQVFLDDPQKLIRVIEISLVFAIFHFTDAVGTTASLFSFIREEGARLPEQHKKKAMYTNGVSAIISGLTGTSSGTCYAESAVGITMGARTGFSALIVAVLFLGVGLLMPGLGNLASFVTAPAIIFAGIMSCHILRKMRYKTNLDRFIMLLLTVYVGITFQIVIGFFVSMVFYWCAFYIRKGRRKA